MSKPAFIILSVLLGIILIAEISSLYIRYRMIEEVPKSSGVVQMTSRDGSR